jgi:anti-anti-sigma factor
MKYEIEDMGKFRMFHIVGNIDSDTSTKVLDNDISKSIASGDHNFVFNLEKTTYLDSAGISIFIHCLCDVQENKGSIHIIAEDNQVRKVLDMVGITRLIRTYNSQREFMVDHKVARK